jgi:hypothetical protein
MVVAPGGSQRASDWTKVATHLPNRLRAGDELSNRIKLMLLVQSWPQKYFDSLQTQITSLSIAFRPDGGRIAIVTDVGCGMRWTLMVLQTTAPKRTAKSCGPDAPTLASSWWKRFHR